ncbi:Na+/H+ antiporter NhaA [Helicobacter sp. 11S03491-1]|uniref:Na+/H+ antiporter NhaA n=1 Tax=Helicobacter sp. 11S03491-1 TaxID=1476196 RepID=UPI000BA5A7DF|nr:Na+/H+ antiporter NhaA [Helicobacter sp. 11S03491-1]PAF42022.1 Na+/H+ antiporter NhaA [Helicobacter sp. 11S03491-1]
MEEILRVVKEEKSQNSSFYIKNKLQKGLHTFIGHESFGGLLLFFCVVIALLIANSDFSNIYFGIWQLEFGGFIGNKTSGITLLNFINDVLMSFFFLMVGLEMKREVLYGELAGFKKVSFSVFGALGGIVVPIIIYLYFNYHTPSQHGFGVAMSTDTAFALGVILFLGKRVPAVIKIFLVTLAVADDLGAISVIALFYTNTLHMGWVYISLGLICVLIYLNYTDTKYISGYLGVGVLLWIAVHNSGIHATVAAVILALCIPGRSNITKTYFMNMMEEWHKINFMTNNGKDMHLDRNEEKLGFFVSSWKNIKNFIRSNEDIKKKIDMEKTSKQVHMLDTIAKYSKYAQNPLIRIEVALQPLCAYFIVPLFAFANAGVKINSKVEFGIDGIFLGTVLGLVVGKPIGIIIFAYLSEKLNFSLRPKGLSYAHIFAVGCLAGIGFTMSMFVANLAYNNPVAIDVSKISILCASFISVILGIIALIFSTNSKQRINSE